ncbi:MAG: hypothetical protein Kow0042_15970 [Calditrichia bacterium]
MGQTRLSLLIVILMVPFLFGQVNLLSNGGFESWTGGLPDFWEFRQPGAHIQASQENSLVHGGTSSCRIYFTTQDQSLTDFTNMTPQVIPGIIYTYKAWVYDNDPAGRVRLVFAWFDAQQQFLSTDYSPLYSVDSTDWQQLIFEKEAPPNAAFGGARFRFYDVASNWDGDCEIFLDDAEVLGPGQNAPVISNVLFQPFSANTFFDITCDVTVSSGSIDSVKLYYYLDFNTAGLDSVNMTYTGIGDQYSVTLGGFPNESSLIYWVKAWGNLTSTQSGTFRVIIGIPDIGIFHSIQDPNGIPLHMNHLTRLRGLVTASSGIFATTRYDFYMQDLTGGINIFSFDPPVTPYTEGDSLEVVGMIDQYNGKVEIVDWQITVLSSGNPLPSPIDVDCANVNESLEGRLITIDNVSLAPTSGPWITTPPDTSFNVTITDGTGELTLRVLGSTDIGGNPEPSWPITVVGIANQYDVTTPYTEGYQIQPRRYADLMGATITFNKTILSGWNLIGLPVEVSDPYYLTLFPNAVPGTLFGWNGSYLQEDSLQLGAGYWLRFPAPEQVTIQGLAVNSIVLDLIPGWNMISGISCDVALTDVNDPGGIIIPGTLFGFDGAYFVADTIKQGNGYWLRASAAGQITLNCGSRQYPDKQRHGQLNLPNMDDFPALRLVDKSGAVQNLYLPSNLPHNLTRESYSLPPKPPVGAFDARFEGDYRLSSEEEAVIYIQSENYPVLITPQNFEQEKSFHYIIREIVDGKEGQTYPIEPGTRITITNPEVKTLRINRISTLPTAFQVSSNYPNPFNPLTRIQYSLPQREKVQIHVINTLGQKVKTLVNQIQEPGRYTVEWNATDDTGRKMSSGIYFLQVKAGQYSALNKMILLK